MQRKKNFGPAPWGPGEGSKGKYHLFSITKSISKIFIPNFVCVLTNERYKTDQTGFFYSVACVMPQGWDFGALEVSRWSKKVIFKHGHVAYQIDEDDEQNKIQVKFSS